MRISYSSSDVCSSDLLSGDHAVSAIPVDQVGTELLERCGLGCLGGLAHAVPETSPDGESGVGDCEAEAGWRLPQLPAEVRRDAGRVDKALGHVPSTESAACSLAAICSLELPRLAKSSHAVADG